jgi:hypothetical protein
MLALCDTIDRAVTLKPGARLFARRCVGLPRGVVRDIYTAQVSRRLAGIQEATDFTWPFVLALLVVFLVLSAPEASYNPRHHADGATASSAVSRGLLLTDGTLNISAARSASTALVGMPQNGIFIVDSSISCGTGRLFER